MIIILLLVVVIIINDHHSTPNRLERIRDENCCNRRARGSDSKSEKRLPKIESRPKTRSDTIEQKMTCAIRKHSEASHGKSAKVALELRTPKYIESTCVSRRRGELVRICSEPSVNVIYRIQNRVDDNSIGSFCKDCFERRREVFLVHVYYLSSINQLTTCGGTWKYTRWNKRSYIWDNI